MTRDWKTPASQKICGEAPRVPANQELERYFAQLGGARGCVLDGPGTPRWEQRRVESIVAAVLEAHGVEVDLPIPGEGEP